MKQERRAEQQERRLPSFLIRVLKESNRQLILLAGFLQRRTDRYSPKRKKILLLAFVVVFISGSSRVILRAFSGESSASLRFSQVKTIRFERSVKKGSPLGKTERSSLQSFKNYMDSLETTSVGRSRKDSLLSRNPHLLDSIEFLINNYREP